MWYLVTIRPDSPILSETDLVVSGVDYTAVKDHNAYRVILDKESILVFANEIQSATLILQ